MITAAALIMISVFLGFVLDEDPRVKMVGLGLAAAILITPRSCGWSWCPR